MTLQGRGDLDDQRWLDERIAAINDGIEAVLDIARNWTELRNLSRLHLGISAQDYILGRVQHPLGRGVVMPLLAESNWSNRQIAAVAGVSYETVRRVATDTNVSVDRPAETLGADGKLRPARVVREVLAEVIEPEAGGTGDRGAVSPPRPVPSGQSAARRRRLALPVTAPCSAVRCGLPCLLQGSWTAGGRFYA